MRPPRTAESAELHKFVDTLFESISAKQIKGNTQKGITRQLNQYLYKHYTE